MVKSRLLGAVGIVAVVVGMAGMSAQTPPSPAFEVASVKRRPSPDFRGQQLQFLPGGRLVIRNMPLGLIVARAYDVPIQLGAGEAVSPRTRGRRMDTGARRAIRH